MKQRSLMKRVSAVLMTAALTISTFPQFHTNVYAAENQLPTKEQFATAEELKTFDTNDQDGKNPAKVYFGNNNQQWWIAGSQDGNLTLFAASPLVTDVKFNPSSSNGTYDGQTVYLNHYGASPLRTTLKDLETSYFKDTERSLMNDTTIYTNDTKNNSVYSTTGRLYLAYGDVNDNQYITVGTNSQNSLNNGLRIDMSYWENSDRLWLRAPFVSNKYLALVAISDFYVSSSDVSFERDLVPAFELNLSSVIFASAAPAATSDGQLQTSDAFTLRYKSENLGSALVSYDKSKVTLTNVPNGTYLVVQNSSEAKAKQITSETEVTATDMGLDSFANCKVWLETTNSNERMTYATLATEEQGYDVNITASDGLTVTNGVQSVAQGNTITDITVEVANGYYLPDDYTDTIQGLNGLNVNVTQTGFTITGTPTSDVNITLPAATILPKADIPEVTISKTATSITATVTNHKAEFGDIEYKWNDGSWEQDKNTLSNLQADTTYQLAVRFTGNGFYQMSDEYSVEITTLTDGNTVIVVPTGLTSSYKEGLKLSDVDLSGTSWTWVDENTALLAGTNSYPATFDTTNLESTTDFSGVDGYDANRHKVTRNIVVAVDKADSNVSITTSSLDKVYDGKEVVNPEYTTAGSDGNVSIKWQEKSIASKSEWVDLDNAPNTVGVYRVVVELEGDANYNPDSDILEFEISKADNTWLDQLSIENWAYGDETKKPSAKAQFGEVIFTYSKEKNGTYTSEMPVNAGTYYVKASVEETKNYTGLESVLQFEISKAVPSYEKVTGLVLGQGQALSSIVLPEKFKWVDETIIGDKLGTHRFEAIYTPEDTVNYQIIHVEIEVEVVPVPEKLNHVPTIKADEVVLTIGDEFKPLKGVSATDVEDGKLKVEVIKNTVDTSKVGIYEVTYKVVDSKGATVNKTIKVKVLEAIEDKEVLEDKIDEITSNVNKDDYTQESYEKYLEALENAKDVLKNPNASKEEIQEALTNLEAAMNKLQKVENTMTPETGDQTNIYLYTSMITLTSLSLVYLSLKKKKTNISK